MRTVTTEKTPATLELIHACFMSSKGGGIVVQDGNTIGALGIKSGRIVRAYWRVSKARMLLGRSSKPQVFPPIFGRIKNAWPIPKPVDLTDGDRVTLGSVNLRFYRSQASQPVLIEQFGACAALNDTSSIPRA